MIDYTLLGMSFFIYTIYMYIDSRQRKFEYSLSVAIRSLSQMMAAGESINSAMVKYVKKTKDMVSSLFDNVISDTKNGLSMADALDLHGLKSNSFLLRYFFDILAHAEREEGDVAKIMKPISEKVRALKETEETVLSELASQITIFHIMGVMIIPFMFVYTAGVLNLVVTSQIMIFLYVLLALFISFDFIVIGDWRKSLIQAPLFIMIFWFMVFKAAPFVGTLF